MGFWNKVKDVLNKINPFTKKEAKVIVRDLMRNRHKIHGELDVGNIIYFEYDPKDRKHIYDRRPLALVLSTSRNYMLGLNFHWIKMEKRIELIEFILKINYKNNKIQTPLKFTYTQLMPFLLKNGYRDCLHLYIKKRIGLGVALKPSYLLEAAKLDFSVFAKG